MTGELIKRLMERFRKKTIKLSHPLYPEPIIIIAGKQNISIPTKVLRWNTLYIGGMNDTVARCEIPGIRNPVLIRARTSDLAVFSQIFIDCDYDIQYNGKPKLIIDGGAYTGLSTAWFANKFPGAHIIAIEPEASNYEMLTRNIQGYDNIEIMNSAIWNKKCYLKIKNANGEKWGFRIEELCSEEQGAIEAVTILEILENSGQDEIDILKLDVETAEIEIFSSGCEEWIGKVNMLIVETHDIYREGSKEAVLSAAKKSQFKKIFRKGERIVLTR